MSDNVICLACGSYPKDGYHCNYCETQRTTEVKRYNPANPLHKKLAKTLPHGTIGALFSDCEMVGVYMYFKSQDALNLADKFKREVKQAMPNAIMCLDSRRLPGDIE